MKIRISDIYNRKNINSRNKDKIIFEDCNLYLYRKTNADLYKLMSEAAKDPYCSNYFFSDIMKFVSENGYNYRLPYIVNNISNENIKPTMRMIRESNLEDEEKTELLNILTRNKNCDRILENHSIISKKVDTEKNDYDNHDIVVDKFCEVVDTFDLPVHGKIGVAIDETCYVLESSGYTPDYDKIVDEAVSFFLIRENNICFDKITAIENAIETNKMIPDNYQGSDESIFDVFDTSPTHNIYTLKDIIAKHIKDGTTFDLFSQLFEHLKLIIIATKDENLKSEISNDLIPYMVNVFIEENMYNERGKERIEFLIGKINDAIDKNSHYINYASHDFTSILPKDTINCLAKFIISLREAKLKLQRAFNITYNRSNIEVIRSSIFETAKPIVLSEVNFDNLNKTINKINDYIKESFKIQSQRATRTTKIKPFKLNDIYDIVNENGVIDFPICVLETEVDFIDQDYLSTVCNNIRNNYFNINRGLDIYYTLSENSAIFNIKGKYRISLTENQVEEVSNNIPDYIIESLYEMNKITKYGDLKFDVDDNIKFFKEGNNIDLFVPYVELCKFANIPEEIVQEIYSTATRHMKLDPDTVYEHKAALRNYSTLLHINDKDALQDIRLESLAVLTNLIYEDEILTEGEIIDKAKKKVEDVKNSVKNKADEIRAKVADKIRPKNDDDKSYTGNKEREVDMDEIDKKNKKSHDTDMENKEKNSITGKLNDIGLVLRGITQKAKDLGSKEEQMSRRADAEFNHFANSLKSAFVPNRREAILKGSVIPSFSRCIKIAIGLAGLGIASGGIAIPAIVALGSFGVSKHLTNKERVLLVDELETELDVIDKEISNAESAGKMKKYRELVKTKKQLQRQYQRLVYGIKLGKDIIPSTTGTPGEKD